MKQLDFERAEFDQRLRRVRAALAEQAVDAMIVHDPTSIYWLTGWRGKGYQIYQTLIVTTEERPLALLTRTSDQTEARATSVVDELAGWRSEASQEGVASLAAMLRERGLLDKRLGYDVPEYYLSVPNYLKLMALLSGTRTSNLTGLIDRLRYRRSPAEIAYVRKAAQINDAGVEAATAALRAGLTETELAGVAHAAMMKAGGGSSASVMNLTSGYRTAFSHGFPSEKVIERGDLIQGEWGANYRAYHCTIGRMWSIGPASARAREVFKVMKAACDAVIAGAGPGVRMADLDAAAMRELGPRYQPHATHKTGYLIKAGFPPAWGDPPALAPNDENVLEEGMLFSVEPPIYLPDEQIGFRIIDNVLVTASGGELLSKTSRELVEI